MKSKIKALVFPSGTEIGLEIYRSLKNNKDIELIGASSSQDHSNFIYETNLYVPEVGSENWVEYLNRVCKKEKIDIIIPAHDEVIYKAALFREDINTKVLIPNTDLVKVLRFKSKTYNKLKKVIRTPRIFKTFKEAEINLPVFCKPDAGQGSRGAIKISDRKTLKEKWKDKSLLFCEFLPGAEYTIDCFSSNGVLIFQSGRERVITKNGISTYSKRVVKSQFEQIARLISEKLKINGPWFFQLKETSSAELCLLEVSARIPGTSCIHRVLGVNFILLGLYQALGNQVSINFYDTNIEVSRALENKYKIALEYQNLYIDYDDTILLGDKINIEAIKLIYNALNSGKNIHLITRHRGDLEKSLKIHRLESLFHSIIHIKDGRPKSDFIVESSIFIDDSFGERLEVSNKLKIPCFGLESLEMLGEK